MDRQLAREIGLVLALKAVALLALWSLCFAPSQHPPHDAAAVRAHLMARP
jgi:hypothetical protein